MLHKLNLLDTAPEPRFDDLTSLAARFLNAPVSLLSLIDEVRDRQFFKSQVGLPEPFASQRQTPLRYSFCKHVARSNAALRVIDARIDERVKNNPAITELDVIAYLGQPILAPDGTSIGSLCVIDTQPRDWTEQDQDTLLRLSRMANAQIALRESLLILKDEKQYLDDLLEAVPVGVSSVDGNGDVFFANQAARNIFGLKPEGYSKLKYDDAAWKITDIDGGPFPPSELPVARILSGENTVKNVVHAVTKADGERRILSIDAVRSKRSVDGTAIICTMTDITDRIAADRKLQEAARQAEAANLAKSAFLSNISHEIRTPLTGILGLTELLQDQPLDATSAKLTKTIYQSGEALLKIVNSVLDLSRIEAGKLSLHPKPFNVTDVLRQQYEFHACAAAQKGVEFKPPRISPAVGVMRIGDDFRIGQALGNLIGNAVKFTQAGQISVEVEQCKGDWVTFTVSDTGIGMTGEQIKRATREFEQADSSTTRIYGGSGLGLAIVSRLLDLMGGKFTLESQPGQGTRASMCLPLQRIATSEMNKAGIGTADATAQSTPDIAGLRVLVAEDNATNTLILRKMLELLDIDAVFVTNGQEACDAWAPEKFDVLLLDISMPVMDGQEALAQICGQAASCGAPRPYAIAVTANAMKHQDEAYSAAGFSAILHKPYKKSDLAQCLTKAAESLAQFAASRTP